MGLSREIEDDGWILKPRRKFSHTGAGLQGQNELSSRHPEEMETDSSAESRTEASSSSNNQGLERLVINGLRYRLGCSEESKDHEFKAKSDNFEEEVMRKAEEEVMSILKKEYPSCSDDHLNLLRRREVLNLANKIIEIIEGEKVNYSQNRIINRYKVEKSNIYSEISKSYYEVIIQDILEKIGDDAEKDNISENLYNAVARDMQCAFSSEETLKEISENINQKITEIDQKINKAILDENEKYKEFKQNIERKANQWEEEIDDILDSSDIIEKIFEDLQNNRIKRIINKFCPCNMKGVKDLKIEVLKESYELRGTITREGKEIGLFSGELDNEKTHFDPSSKEIHCLHADDPEREGYKERMENLREKLDALKEAKWYQDWPKKWRGKLAKYAPKICKLHEEIESNMDMDKGKRRVNREKLFTWQEEIKNIYDRYQYHHEAEEEFTGYLEMIGTSLILNRGQRDIISWMRSNDGQF